MGYKVDYASMQGLMSEYSCVIGNWSEGISSVIQKEQAIEVSKSISGNRANNMKQYLATVYSCASDSMMILLELFRQNYLLYLEDYYSRIDPERGTRIDAMELSRLRAELQEKRSRFQQIGINAENSVGKVSDIVSTPSLDIAGVDTKIGSIITSLDNLDRDINTLESDHASADFAVIDEMLSSLDAYFMELIGQSKEFKTGFSPETFYALASISSLSISLSRAFDQITAQKSNVALAMTNLEKRLEQDRKELEERQKKAKYAKIGINIVVGVVSAVCIAACPAAAPVVGMVSGLVTSTVSAALDEYATHGFEMSEWDTARIGAHACIGTVTGLIGGCVAPGAGMVAKAGVKGISSALEGALTTSYDQLSTYGRIVDTKAVLLDAAEKGGASFAGSLAGGYISKNIKTIGISSLDLAKDDPLSKMHGLSVFLYEGGKSAGSGVVKRGISNLTGQVISNSTDGSIVKMNEINFESIRDDMFSAQKIGENFFGSGLSGMASDHVALRTPDEKSGLTPIIQYKLGHTTDPETGLTAVVQESLSHIVDEDEFQDVLRDMEERNPSTGGSPVSPVLGDSLSTSEEPRENYVSHNELATDWENTANSPDEIHQIKEMEQNGEFEIDGEDYSAPETTKDFVEARFPTMRTPQEDKGIWLGDRGNSRFVPNDPEAQAVMKEYGQESVAIQNSHPDFKPFTMHDTPWGNQDCEVKIGHMTSQRTGADGNYYQADEELARKIGGGVTRDDIRHYREENKLTWHEVEDGKTMQLIPTVINGSVAHTGGTSVSGYGQKMGDIAHDYE